MNPNTMFELSDLRGGINNTDSPTLLPENQVVDARNVDFRQGALGAKRRGTAGIDLTGSTIDSPVIAIIRHTPTNLISNDELWIIDENGNIDRRVGETWSGGVPRSNDFVVVNANNYEANGVSLHGKLFIAAQGTQDRLLVWDGTVLRWAGMSQPAAPTAANSVPGGTYSGTRYFRIRYTIQAAGVTLERSEPTTVVTINPSGTNTGVVITKPAGTEAPTSVSMEGQTHWEVEASIDNILFYRIATVAIGTSTYTDTTVYTTGYTANPLSENIGEYVIPGSVRHVAVDEDRVVMAGSYFTPGLDSTVWWTPVNADDGVGNDERIPITTNNFITFDGLDGGAVTALVAGVSGNVYVFKTSRVYKMVRTGIVTSAYAPVAESFARGSVRRGACAGTDQTGVPCVYFLDQSVGLCRIGQRGLEDLSRPIRDFWRTINTNAIIGPRILFYPALDQVWYTISTGSSDQIQTSQSTIIETSSGEAISISQTGPNTLVDYEVRYGATMFHDGVLGTAQALGLIYKGNAMAPVIGTVLTPIAGGNFSYLHDADIGTTDGGTPYLAYVRTKPYTLAGLFKKFGLMSAVLLAKASTTSLNIKFIRNFGVEQRSVVTSLAAVGAEDHVVRPIDDANMSELNTIQLEYGDGAVALDQEFSIDSIVFRVRLEDDSA